MPAQVLISPGKQALLPSRRLTPWIWPILAVPLLALLNLHMGMSEFGGYDLSALIDSAWRVRLGQAPNVSFICTFPPSCYLPVELAFRLFGLHWVLLLIAEDILYLLLCLLGLRLCWIVGAFHGEGAARSLAWMYVAIQTIPLLTANHLWHSTTASALAAYGVLATHTLLALAGTPHRWEAAAHVALAVAGLALSKPNVALPAILLFAACLAADKRSRRFVLPVFLAAAALDLLVLVPFHITLLDVLRGYADASGRAQPFLFFVGIYPQGDLIGLITVPLTYYLLAVPALPFIAHFRERRPFRPTAQEWLCLGAGLITLVGLGTNWDLRIIDAPPFLMGCAVAATLMAARYARMVRPTQWSIAILFLLAVALGAGRIRMWVVGPWAGPRYGPKVMIHDRFFGTFQTRQAFAELLQESDAVVSHARGERIFFGPRMEFLYARDRIASPLHLPLWWHPGSSYALSQEPGIDDAWEQAHFDVLIFAKNDRTRYPAQLLNDMKSQYSFDGHWKQIDVFYLRNP